MNIADIEYTKPMRDKIMWQFIAALRRATIAGHRPPDTKIYEEMKIIETTDRAIFARQIEI